MALTLDIDVRQRVARDVLTVLARAEPGSTTELRGSLASGRGDAYSDIDVLWLVPVDRLDGACASLEGLLAAVGPVDSLRWASDADGRTAFVHLAGLPLFWRLDLAVRSAAAAAGAAAMVPEQGPVAAVGEGGSHTYSALMCAVAATKAFLRDRPDDGARLVSKGFERIHVPVPAVGPRQQILALAETLYDADDSLALLADDLRRLYRDAFEG